MNTNQIKEIKENYMIEYIKYCFENYDDIVYEGGADIPDNFEEKLNMSLTETKKQ